jgi:hypothetical protein
MAEDTSLPQAVRNEYLDKANAIEKEAAKPTMAKGGAVSKAAPKKMMYGDMTEKMAKGGAAKKPAVAIMIAVGKPKAKMAKGGAVAKKGCK